MNKMKYIKRRFMTLVEMMIVMFLIAMITGVIAYNYAGSLDEGKAFKTKTGIEKIKQVLSLQAADGDVDDIKDNWKALLDASPLVKNSKELYKDGWGNDFEVNVVDGEIKVTSAKYDSYINKKDKSTMFGKDK